MPLYMIRRDVHGATREDIDAAAYRAIACAFYFTGMKWHHSYWDEQAGELRCIYEAQNSDELWAHAERARIPCNDVREVTIVGGPEMYIGEEAGEELQASSYKR